MYSLGSMVCGSDADSAASRNRSRLIATSTSAYRPFSTAVVRRPVTTNAGQAERQDAQRQVGHDENLPARPSVEDDADERSDDRERKERDGEHDGHRRGVGLAFRREQDVGGQRDLQQAVR